MKLTFRDIEMAHWGKVYATKPDGMALITWIHRVEGGYRFLKFVLICTVVYLTPIFEWIL